MSAKIIAQTDDPLTAHALAEQLHACGLRTGRTVLVHMAMSRLGWVVGGAEAVILAFLEVLGPTGTLMMPTHTLNNTDPAEWQNPPIPQSWWQIVRDHTPAYNPATTPTAMMGAVPELLRTWPGARRSAHPVTSFAALGPNAEYLTADAAHPIEVKHIAQAEVRLFKQRGLVDFAVAWMEKHRDLSGGR